MGFGKNIIVDVDEKTASVRDYGQGIPLGSVIKAVSILNTSGRFDDYVYQKTIGLNGVGIKATNSLSLDFYVASYRDGESSWAKFSQGELVDSGREKTSEKNGTFVRFTPDNDMFPNYAYRMEIVEQMVRNYICVKVGLTITFNGILRLLQVFSRLFYISTSNNHYQSRYMLRSKGRSAPGRAA